MRKVNLYMKGGENKTGTSQVGAISKAFFQKYIYFKKSRKMPKNLEKRPFRLMKRF